MDQYSGNLKSLGATVRRLRKERKLTQEALADLSELHTNHLGGIERGERNVTVKGLFKLAHALAVHPSVLLGGRTPE